LNRIEFSLEEDFLPFKDLPIFRKTREDTNSSAGLVSGSRKYCKMEFLGILENPNETKMPTITRL